MNSNGSSSTSSSPNEAAAFQNSPAALSLGASSESSSSSSPLNNMVPLPANQSNVAPTEAIVFPEGFWPIVFNSPECVAHVEEQKAQAVKLANDVFQSAYMQHHFLAPPTLPKVLMTASMADILAETLGLPADCAVNVRRMLGQISQMVGADVHVIITTLLSKIEVARTALSVQGAEKEEALRAKEQAEAQVEVARSTAISVKEGFENERARQIAEKEAELMESRRINTAQEKQLRQSVSDLNEARGSIETTRKEALEVAEKVRDEEIRRMKEEMEKGFQEERNRFKAELTQMTAELAKAHGKVKEAQTETEKQRTETLKTAFNIFKDAQETAKTAETNRDAVQKELDEEKLQTKRQANDIEKLKKQAKSDLEKIDAGEKELRQAMNRVEELGHEIDQMGEAANYNEQHSMALIDEREGLYMETQVLRGELLEQQNMISGYNTLNRKLNEDLVKAYALIECLQNPERLQEPVLDEDIEQRAADPESLDELEYDDRELDDLDIGNSEEDLHLNVRPAEAEDAPNETDIFKRLKHPRIKEIYKLVNDSVEEERRNLEDHSRHYLFDGDLESAKKAEENGLPATLQYVRNVPRGRLLKKNKNHKITNEEAEKRYKMFKEEQEIQLRMGVIEARTSRADRKDASKEKEIIKERKRLAVDMFMQPSKKMKM